MNGNIKRLIAGIGLVGLLNGCSKPKQLDHQELITTGTIDGNKVELYEEAYSDRTLWISSEWREYRLDLYDGNGNLRASAGEIRSLPNEIIYDNLK